MAKKIMKIEVGDRIHINELWKELEDLAIEAQDSYDFEDILNEAMQSLYRAQPGGQENYGNENPRVGKVWLRRTKIDYTPSDLCKERGIYIQKPIATINLRKRSYFVEWDKTYNERYHQIPEVLMRDTERVMKCLGMTRKTRK